MASTDSYTFTLRDDKTAFLHLHQMYQASMNHASTLTDVRDDGVCSYVQHTAAYNIDPINMVNGVVAARPTNPRPLLLNNPTAAAISIYKFHLEEFLSTASSVRDIHTKIMNGLSPTATLAVNAHATTTPLVLKYPWMLWDFLHVMYGTYTEEQIRHFKDQLTGPMSDSDTLQSHNVTFHRLISFLTTINQPLSNVDQMSAYHNTTSLSKLITCI